MSNGPWTDEENDLIVADYFASKDRATAEKYFWRNSAAAYRWVRRGAAATVGQ